MREERRLCMKGKERKYKRKENENRKDNEKKKIKEKQV